MGSKSPVAATHVLVTMAYCLDFCEIYFVNCPYCEVILKVNIDGSPTAPCTAVRESALCPGASDYIENTTGYSTLTTFLSLED